MEPVLVVGAGHQGLAMAAHFALNGESCFLWNRTKGHIQCLIENPEIICEGIVNGIAKIQKVSSKISEVLQKRIMIATPSSAHYDIARMLAPYMNRSYTIVLNPGRTYGALEFANTLRQYGCKELPHIAETQTIVYTCRKVTNNRVHIYALKDNIPVAGLNPEDTKAALLAFPECIRGFFSAVDSYMLTSLGNVGMVLHCAPVLMNVGWIESPKAEFKYYYDGITPSIAKLLEKLDAERVEIALAMGIKVETLGEWLLRIYQASGKNLYEQLQNNVYYKEIDAPNTIQHRYLEEDVPNGLVPLESTAKCLKIDTPITSLIIDLANAVMEKDYRQIGRQYIVNYETNEKVI